MISIELRVWRTWRFTVSQLPRFVSKHFLISLAGGHHPQAYDSGSAILLLLATICAPPRCDCTYHTYHQNQRLRSGYSHLVMQRPFNLFPCYIPPTSSSSYSGIVQAMYCFPVALGQVCGFKLFHSFYLCHAFRWSQTVWVCQTSSAQCWFTLMY